MSTRPGQVSFVAERRWNTTVGTSSTSEPTQMWIPACQSPSRVDSSTPLPQPGAVPVRVEDVEHLVLRIGGGSAQKRSRTPSRAPSEISWTVSSFRPGWISRRTTASIVDRGTGRPSRAAASRRGSSPPALRRGAGRDGCTTGCRCGACPASASARSAGARSASDPRERRPGRRRARPTRSSGRGSPVACPGHPGQHPGVHAVVLVDQLVASAFGVEAHERLPDVAARADAGGDVLELGRG